MKTLATAFPNHRYLYFHSIAHIILEARLTNNKVYFYEVWLDKEGSKEKEVKHGEKTIKKFFKEGQVKHKPWLKTGKNKDFYAILYRSKKHYFEHYKIIKNANKNL